MDGGDSGGGKGGKEKRMIVGQVCHESFWRGGDSGGGMKKGGCAFPGSGLWEKSVLHNVTIISRDLSQQEKCVKKKIEGKRIYKKKKKVSKKYGKKETVDRGGRGFL